MRTALTANDIKMLNRHGPPNAMGDRLSEMQQAGNLRYNDWINPAAASQTAVLAATAQPSSGSTTVTSGITPPDFARVLQIKGNQSTCTGNVVINGTDRDGSVIQDTIAASGTSAVSGVKAFKTITSIVIPTRGASGDTISVGYIDALGLDRCLPVNSVLTATMDGTRETTFPTVTFDASDLSKNTVDPNTALDGAKDLRVYFIDTFPLS